MSYNNILDDVISSLQPEDLPADYIIMARVVDLYGIEKILRGTELEKFMNNPNRHAGVMEASVILNVQKIRLAIITALTIFFDDLKIKVDSLPPVPPKMIQGPTDLL